MSIRFEGTALLAPSKLIAANAGVGGDIVVETIRASEWQIGYNAMNGRYEDHLAIGVVDPCRVSRCALQNAVSIAGIILTTQVVLVEKIKTPKPPIPLVPLIKGVGIGMFQAVTFCSMSLIIWVGATVFAIGRSTGGDILAAVMSSFGMLIHVFEVF